MLDMPDVLAQGSLIRYVFTPEEPSDYDDSCYIGNEESVPAPSDLRPIMAELEAAFKEGMRSIVFTVRFVDGSEHTQLAHFRKARYILLNCP